MLERWSDEDPENNPDLALFNECVRDPYFTKWVTIQGLEASPALMRDVADLLGGQE